MNVKDLKSGQVFELYPETVSKKFKRWSRYLKLEFIVESKQGRYTIIWKYDKNNFASATRVKIGNNTAVYNTAFQDWIQDDRRRRLISLILENRFKDEL